MSQSQAQHCEDDITRLTEKQKLVPEGWMLKHEEKIVTGNVRVANEHFEKQVGVRYTLDDWSTSWDVKAEWQESVGDNNETDRFSFTIQLPAAGWSGRVHLLSATMQAVRNSGTTTKDRTIEFMMVWHLIINDCICTYNNLYMWAVSLCV